MIRAHSGAHSPAMAEHVAIVTGAASGIGRAACAALAVDGYRIAAVDLPGREAALREVGEPLAVDVADANRVAELVEDVERELGPVSVLVTAAGFIDTRPVRDIADDQWRRMLAVHLEGTFNCCRAVAPRLVERSAGAIVTISSELALTGSEGNAHYCAAKGAILAFTQSIALELAPHGVRVNCVAPGPTDTPLLTDEWRSPEYLAMLPLRRLARPEEVAAAIRFLASDEAGFFVGDVLSPNCGAVI